MKPRRKITLIVLLGMLAVFMVTNSIYRGVQSVGWSPPDTSLKLDVNEKKWKAAFQKKNGKRRSKRYPRTLSSIFCIFSYEKSSAIR